ncbi:myosin-binding protein 7-like [Impatiens glandulifera]|uniref:myosin-binding protein 7-like n=1 Tax=Impatiens glandulifera TaxID=253017 RepID=UPI001FB0B215|nr:myosin-binding protein 7-like [Impatiens glandulifera]
MAEGEEEKENSLMQNNNRSNPGTWHRSVKRKLAEFDQGNATIPTPEPAKVEVPNDFVELRTMTTNQQKTIQDLTLELEEERNASSSAANEAMSMIIRLQNEKAESQMEARQFKRIIEEKMTHDQHEISAMEELLYKKEQTIQSLNCEVQAYKHRMMSYGLTESEADGDQENGTIMSRDSSLAELTDLYPPLKCNLNENQYRNSENNYETTDVDKYAFGETPRPRDHLKDLEFRINQLERSPRTAPTTPTTPEGAKNAFEKIVGQSPRRPRHFRRISTGSSNSVMATIKETSSNSLETSPRFSNLRKMESMPPYITNLGKFENSSKIVDDDMSDRVYTINVVSNSETKPQPPHPVHNNNNNNNVDVFDDDMNNTPKESVCQADGGDEEVKRLYMRLQALEADRESMRQSIISMRTEKAQLVLLKEVAQHMCKDMSTPRLPAPYKQSQARRFSFLSIFKWIACIVFWRKRARRSKYIFGASNSNSGPGLLSVLEMANNVPRLGQGRYLSSIHIV